MTDCQQHNKLPTYVPAVSSCNSQQDQYGVQPDYAISYTLVYCYTHGQYLTGYNLLYTQYYTQYLIHFSVLDG